MNLLKNEEHKAYSLPIVATKWGFPDKHFTKSPSRTHTGLLCTMLPPATKPHREHKPTHIPQIASRSAWNLANE